MAGFDAEAFLDSLEPVGWKLGLERMHKLCTVLGMPQHRFASIHVVGTNGKSSVTWMTAALLEAHGVATGACVSPHPSRWSERVLLRGAEIAPEAFAAAVERTAEAAEVVDRGLREAERSEHPSPRDRSAGDALDQQGEVVTQFEVATAAAFVAFAAARVQAAVVEAGLGGRLDATNTIPSRVTALTSVGLDHTEWLGGTVEQIAAEKLAVLRDHSTLVVGRLDPAVEALAERIAAQRGARLIRAPEDPGEDVALRAAGGFQRRNFALATTVAEAYLGRAPDPEAVREVAATLAIPGRLERLAERPLTLIDVAHNPDGARALAEALPEVLAADRRSPASHPIAGQTEASTRAEVVGVLAVLADKDAEGIVAALAPALDRAVCTQLPADGPKTGAGVPKSAHRPFYAADELAAACGRAGLAAEAVPELGGALARARVLAGQDGAVLVTGSHYVLGPARAALP